MILTSSQSININLAFSHSIPDPLKVLFNKIRSEQRIPDPLKVLFNKIRLEHYEELYEPEADGTTSLQDTLNEVIEALHSNNQIVSHLRYLWMTLILTLVVEPTLEYYQPSNLLPKTIISLIVLKLRNNISSSSNLRPKVTVDKLLNEIVKKRNVYSNKELASFQIIDEALDVFDNAMRVIDYEQAVEAIIEILDNCLEGYAIFPGSYGRRELFDWWLLDVVPASWYLLPPKSFYVVEGRQNQENIKSRQTKLLEQVSFEIWSVLLCESNSKKEANLHILYGDERYTSTKIKYARSDREIGLDNINLKFSKSNHQKNTQSETVYFV